MEYHGIDVSFHKGYPDWSKARDSVDFAILGVTELYGKDKSFEHNYKGCRDNGIAIGAYKFSYARSWADSKAEADDIVTILKGRPVEMGIWLDLEWDVQAAMPETLLRDIIEGFRDGIESGGYEFGGIYCNSYWYNTFIPEYAKRTYRFWIASYPYNDLGTEISSLRPSVGNLAGWQYSENGNIPGFGAQGVDLDVWYYDIPDIEPQAPVTAPSDDPVLSYGNSGIAVEQLQVLLNDHGANLAIDGIFGANTRAAVYAYQRQNGLDPDGIVGPLTWASLKAEKSPYDIANEVLKGLWGNGEERRQKLLEAGYDYDTIQGIVNKLA